MSSSQSRRPGALPASCARSKKPAARAWLRWDSPESSVATCRRCAIIASASRYRRRRKSRKGTSYSDTLSAVLSSGSYLVVTEAIVLAGGLGTRLRSVVPDAPKAMAPIAGQPFLAYLLQFLEAQGIARVVLAVGYRNQAIRDFFGTRYQGLQLVYSVEEEPLGTGGALLQALPSVGGRYAFMLNGDTFLRLQYRAMADKLDEQPDTDLVVALRPVPDARRYGAALVAGGRIRGFTAQGTQGPGLINAGCY